jgi:hypothetical protein
VRAPVAIRLGAVDWRCVCAGTLLRSEPRENRGTNASFLRTRAYEDPPLLQQGHKGGGKALQIAMRINFSTLLFAIISDKSASEECLVSGAGLRVYIAQLIRGGTFQGVTVRGRGLKQGNTK